MGRRESCTQPCGTARARKQDGASRGSKAARGRTTYQQTELNRVICDLADKGDMEGLLDTVQAKQAQMNLVNLSTAYHRLVRFAEEGQGRCLDEQDPRVQALQQGIRAHISWMHSAEKRDPHPRCLSTIAWSCGRCGHVDPEVMQLIGELSMEWIDLFKPFELANLLWGFAKLQLPQQSLFHLAQDHVLTNLDKFAPRSLSVVAWAFATARPPLGCGRLLCRSAEAFAATVQASEEKPVSLANLVWALATTGVHPKQEVLHAIGDVATIILGQFKVNELSITLWAFARLGCFHEKLFAAAMQRLCRDAVLQQDMHPQGITNTLWALSRFAEHHLSRSGGSGLRARLARGLSYLVPTCLRLLPHLSSMEFASTRASLAKLETAWGFQTDAAKILLAATEDSTRPAEQLAEQPAWSLPVAEAGDARLVDALLQVLGEPSAGGGCLNEIEEKSSFFGQGMASQESELPEEQQPMKVHVSGLLAPSGRAFAWAADEPAYLPMVSEEEEQEEAAGEAPGAAEQALPWPSHGLAAAQPCPVAAAEADLAGDGASAVTEPVVLSVVPEFSEVHGKDSEDASVTVAVEVETLSGHEAVIVSVEVCTDDIAEHCSSFVVTMEGLYRLSVPPRAGDWEMRLITRDAEGTAVAQALCISFTGAWSPCLDMDEVKVEKEVGESSGASDLGSTCASLVGSRFGSSASSQLEEVARSGGASNRGAMEQDLDDTRSDGGSS